VALEGSSMETLAKIVSMAATTVSIPLSVSDVPHLTTFIKAPVSLNAPLI
jgi:hypothetical protein